MDVWVHMEEAVCFEMVASRSDLHGAFVCLCKFVLK